MNFQDLKKIEKPNFYIDNAFSKASKKIDLSRKKTKGDRINKSKTLELTRIEIIRTVLNNHLDKITTSFPSIDGLDPFYVELIKCTLDYKDLKKSLGAVNFAKKTISSLYKKYSFKIKQTSDIKFINKLRNEFLGRTSSVFKQIKNNLEYLEESRKSMRDYPSIKTTMFTVCIFGFPNAGKSTLLKKLTDANPEIHSYAFTTKKLNLGYIKTPKFKIQIIDTPGTLNRINKMNYIELQAHLAIEHLANATIYVFDPTFEYDMDRQRKLLKRLKEYKKEGLLYLSKTDVADKKIVDEFIKKYPKILTVEQIKEELIKMASKFYLS